jgi:hypothetical protein
VGVNVKLKRTELNIGFSLLEINSTKFKDPNQLNPQFGPATNNILTGFNATSVGFELIFPIK